MKTNTNTEKSYKILGVNDDESTCDCCGKRGLNSVVWIENLLTGEIRHFGTTCALQPAKALGITKQEVDGAARDFKRKMQAVFRNAWIAYKNSGGKMNMVNDYTWEYADKELHSKMVAEARKQLSWMFA